MLWERWETVSEERSNDAAGLRRVSGLRDVGRQVRRRCGARAARLVPALDAPSRTRSAKKPLCLSRNAPHQLHTNPFFNTRLEASIPSRAFKIDDPDRDKGRQAAEQQTAPSSSRPSSSQRVLCVRRMSLKQPLRSSNHRSSAGCSNDGHMHAGLLLRAARAWGAARAQPLLAATLLVAVMLAAAALLGGQKDHAPRLSAGVGVCSRERAGGHCSTRAAAFLAKRRQTTAEAGCTGRSSTHIQRQPSPPLQYTSRPSTNKRRAPARDRRRARPRAACAAARRGAL